MLFLTYSRLSEPPKADISQVIADMNPRVGRSGKFLAFFFFFCCLGFTHTVHKFVDNSINCLLFFFFFCHMKRLKCWTSTIKKRKRRRSVEPQRCVFFFLYWVVNFLWGFVNIWRFFLFISKSVVNLYLTIWIQEVSTQFQELTIGLKWTCSMEKSIQNDMC